MNVHSLDPIRRLPIILIYGGHHPQCGRVRDPELPAPCGAITKFPADAVRYLAERARRLATAKNATR